MSNKGKYVSVGVLHYRSDLDDKKAPARTYKPNQTIDEDMDKGDVERLLASGAIRESKVAQQELKAREEAAATAQQAEEARVRAAEAAQQAVAQGAADPAAAEAAAADAVARSTPRGKR